MKRGLPILTFHSIDDSGSPISMAAGQFRQLMENLARDDWIGCTLDEAISPSAPAGPRQIGICFDDGYRNVLEGAVPVLRDLGFAATVFVIAGRCGDDNRWPEQASWVPTMPLLDWPDLEKLRMAGWEIGSHGCEHSSLTLLEPSRLRQELQSSRALLEQRLDATVRLLAYPNGATNALVADAARSVYDTAFSTRLALATEADLAHSFDVPRVDAFYLRHWPAAVRLDSPGARAYLALRRTLRRLRHRPPS